VPQRSHTGTYPAVTILKPLHGAEPRLYDNLVRFCTQDYPAAVQVVFGVADAVDPAIAIVHRVIADLPGRDLEIVVDPRRHGANRKISNLINMAERARHDVLVISDSDIVVDADYLKQVVASLDQPGVGAVTCLYRGAPAGGLWARLAAAAIDFHFLPSVLVGLRLGLATPCFGSTIALRAKTLAMIGGLQSVADRLADDHAIGALVRRTGLKVAIPQFTVGHVCSHQSAHDLVRHELRWARTIRSVDPLGFIGSAITHAMPLALLALVLGGMTSAGAAVLGAAIACRFVLHLQIARAFHLGDGVFWLAPIRDVFSFAVFIGSFFGRDVQWRGHRYDVRPDRTLAYAGKIEP
jgi:ceramide glucosyltransferase